MDQAAGRDNRGLTRARDSVSLGIMSGIKVAYILLWFPKPSETFIFREIKALNRAGCRVVPASLYGPWQQDLTPEMEKIRVARLGPAATGRLLAGLAAEWRRRPGPVSGLAARSLFRIWGRPEIWGESLWAALTGPYLARYFLARGVTHIHAPWARGPATAAWVAARISGLPFSFSGRAHDIFNPDRALGEKIRAATFVRCESEAARETLARIEPGSAAKLKTVHSGLTIPWPTPAPVGMNPPVRLLGLGRMVPKKGFDRLLRAARLLRDRGLDFRLTLAGSGPEADRLKGLARRLGLEAEVEWPGFVPHDRVPSLLAGSDILIMPSIVDSRGDRDGLPNVVVEALAHGLPVVATDISSLGRVVIDRETGRLVKPDDPEGLAEAVLDLVADPARARALGLAGRELVRREFDPERRAADLIRLFEEHSAAEAEPD